MVRPRPCLVPFATPLVVAASAILLLVGCASTPDFSALEDDEMYLRRGEEFVTDAMYLAFALEQSAEEPTEDDYYEPNRAEYSPGYVGGYGMPGYQPSFYNPYRPFDNGFGNGFGTTWGMASYLNPYAAGGMGFGYGMGGYDPLYNNWGSPYAMGYGSGFGYGYGPNAWNNGWNNGWNNPYGYSGWNSGWNSNYGGWTGNNDTYSGMTGRTRTPIMSYTGNGSNYDSNGILVRPKVEAQRPDEVPAVAPEQGGSTSPTYVAPTESSRAQKWMQAILPDGAIEELNTNRSWGLPATPANESTSPPTPSRTNSSSAPSNVGGTSRSGGATRSGGSSSSATSRSSRGGGQ